MESGKKRIIMHHTTLPQTLIDSYEMEGYTDRPMLPGEADKMLYQHDAEPTDTTGWTLFEVLDYLNY